MRIKIKEVTVLTILLAIVTIAGRAQGEAEKINELMNSYSENLDFNGAVLIAEKGNVIYKNAFGYANRELAVPNSIDTKFRIASMSKAFTAFVIMELVEEGKISLDGKLSWYLNDFPKDKGDKITIRHLLSHTSGMGHYFQAPDYEAWYERLVNSSDEMIKYFGELDLLFEPGEKYSYSSFGYSLLAFICEKVMGKSYNEILREKVLDPLGMKNTKQLDNFSIDLNAATGYEWRQLSGYEKPTYVDASKIIGGGGMISTLEDMLIWDKALYSNDLLNHDNLSMLFQPQSKITKDLFYGYGWLIRKSPIAEGTVYYHGGSTNGFRSLISRYPATGHMIVIFTNSHNEAAGGDTRGLNINKMSDQISAILFDKPYELSKKSAANEIAIIAFQSGAEEALDRYNELKSSCQDDYYFSELEINIAAYALYDRHHRYEDALLLFEFNKEEFPKSYNVYDSLGWLFKREGKNELALKYYKMGLEIYNKYPELNKRWERDAKKAPGEIAKLKKLIQNRNTNI